ncbi:APC family permease [Acidipila sp. EB88]|uniref:APC family permease n=1 Tax=Acidipila sp. EB88 TaxID=2305226 RepID=UPI000F60035C|nr:APC family permease [Acidipila sp. EB88]
MLTFISFWRAAAVVLNDLGSSAFYAGGIAEESVGKSAPWFILGVMVFAFSVRKVYIESCSMFTRGGVYRVVKEALGGTFAKVSVSALMFDYILTGPISGVSAGQYITGLLNELLQVGAIHNWLPPALLQSAHAARQLPVDGTSAVFCVLVTIFYWWENIKGIKESTGKALEVMKITTVMVVIIIVWGIYTALSRHASFPPPPIPSNLHFSHDALGFLAGTHLATTLGLFGIIMAFGHSVLAMSGEETLAQVNREIEHPKLKNLKRAATVIAIYSFSFTGLVSLLAVMIIPDAVRIPIYRDNIISGLAMYMAGPITLRIIFRVFVVVVGFLILSGAVNTSLLGSTGVLMRIAEDGVLSDWFRKPHRRFGTSYRIVNLVAVLQLFTIIVTRGNVIVLGEAYAFGVIWSFTFNALAMLVLRWKYQGERGWKVPINLKINGREIPLGLLSVFCVLLTTAVTNLFTKSVATVSGIVFSLVFFIIFTISERQNARRQHDTALQMKEHFQLEHEEDIGRENLQIKRGGVLVTLSDPTRASALKWALARSNTDEQDIVVLTARMVGTGGSEYLDPSEQSFSEHEQMLFTKAVSVAESFGKHISLLVVPAAEIFTALVRTAVSLEVALVVSGLASTMTATEQAYQIGHAWEILPEPKQQFTYVIVTPDGQAQTFHLGAHAPTLNADDVQLVHRLWLNISRDPGFSELHHSDIVTYALTRLASDYARNKPEILDELRRTGCDGRRSVATLRSPVPTAAANMPMRALRENDRGDE